MWAMEYNPNIYSLYEAENTVSSNGQLEGKLTSKELKQYGKFERKNMENGLTEQKGALAVFLVASVLENKNKQLLKEAQGMDDIVQVLLLLLLNCILEVFLSHFLQFWETST